MGNNEEDKNEVKNRKPKRKGKRFTFMRIISRRSDPAFESQTSDCALFKTKPKKRQKGLDQNELRSLEFKHTWKKRKRNRKERKTHKNRKSIIRGKRNYFMCNLKGLMGLLERIPTRRGRGQTTGSFGSDTKATEPFISSRATKAFCWRLKWFIFGIRTVSAEERLFIAKSNKIRIRFAPKFCRSENKKNQSFVNGFADPGTENLNLKLDKEDSLIHIVSNPI